MLMIALKAQLTRNESFIYKGFGDILYLHTVPTNEGDNAKLIVSLYTF